MLFCNMIKLNGIELFGLVLLNFEELLLMFIKIFFKDWRFLN